MQHKPYPDEALMQGKALERRNEELMKLVETWQSNLPKNKPQFNRSLNMHEVENLIIQLYKVYKIPISLFDEFGKILFSIGWKNNCFRLQGTHIQDLKFCQRNFVFPLIKGDSGNYVINLTGSIRMLAIPILVRNEVIGTILANQYLCPDQIPEEDEIINEAFDLNLDADELRKAYKQLPVLNKLDVYRLTELIVLLADTISYIASRNLDMLDMEALQTQKRDMYLLFKDKLTEQASFIKSIYQLMMKQHQEIETLKCELLKYQKKPDTGQKQKNLAVVQPG